MDAVIYIHGKGGDAKEVEHYRPLFPSCEAIGIEYEGDTPWSAGEKIRQAVKKLKSCHDGLILIANSIGAYFAMHAQIEEDIVKAYFVSPIVDMEKLIGDMMALAGVSESILRKQGRIPTGSGEDLSWEYLTYVREHPLVWNVPTKILYGSEDQLTSKESIEAFAKKHHAKLTVMEGGEHWFHTKEQMAFLDAWITEEDYGIG
ncbi:MAG: alpha/beta hydrolase [Erysipelotrichaceae bacterium]|nr:alpha/beta hydrolase [Erysipelotrichaceae bacterium]